MFILGKDCQHEGGEGPQLGPSPRLGKGTPILPDWGYPILPDGGTPSFPLGGGTPIWLTRGITHQDWMGVAPLHWDWMGVPPL